ncbi:hypothetical protein VSDG_00923 [Cytospora chrysosperma]|uniref:LysM domain-containing protein n=1 Tax=Cytospora chrysosperma TaxID=252740 RepID=A0A423WLG8_CYTCH|nr:hypothetical protein VSDG_00923 [Valsa sordida]
MKAQQLITFMGMAFSAVVSALPSQRSTSACTAGLTAWSDANFAGTSHQYNVAWDTCISMAAEFPYNQAAGVSSVKANTGNWCTMYPNTDCNPGQNRANDTLDVIGSYYDLADPEESWDNLPQSFSCKQYNC